MRPTVFQIFLRVFMNVLPVIGLVGGAYWLRTDNLEVWNFALLYLGALAWGYARGRATEEMLRRSPAPDAE